MMRVSLTSAIVVLFWAALVAAAPKVAATSLEGRINAALTAGRAVEAGELADDLWRRRVAQSRLTAPAAATLIDSLGLRFFQAGTPESWTVAERLFRLALERRERALGADHADVAGSLGTLATLLDYQGRWSDAVPLAERALAIRARALGESHASTAGSLRQLGLLKFQLGDYAAAAPLLARSVAVYAALGAGHEARLADGLNNLGELARIGDRFDDADAHFRRGLEVARAHLAEDAPLLLALTTNLAGLLKDLGRFDAAEPLLECVLEQQERAAQPNSEALATASLNLAEVYRLQGRPLEAAPLYDRALEQARRALGPDHPGLVPFLNQAAVGAQDLGRFAAAESLYGETRAIVERTLGPDHPLLAQNLNDVASLQLAAGRTRDAETTYRRALVLRERTFGAAHPEVALTLVDLARTLDTERGAALIERAIAILDSTRAYPEARLDAYAARAEGHAVHGRSVAAIADMAEALSAVDVLRSRRGGGDDTRAAFLARRLGLFDRMIVWQLGEGAVGTALETHERARARVLLDQIAAGGVDLRAGIEPATRATLEAAERAAETRLAGAQQRIQAVRADPSLSARARLESIAALEAARDSATFDLARAGERIKDASPLWRQVLSAEGRTATAADLARELVPRDGMLLVYHVGAEGSVVFAVPHRGPVRAHPLSLGQDDAATLGVPPGPLTGAALERIVTGARSSVWPDSALGVFELLSGSRTGGFMVLQHRSDSGSDSLSLRLHALWRALMPAALWRDVRKARIAIVVPDGALHLIPFEALATRTGGPAGTTQFWLDDGPALSYGVSATSLMSLARRAPRATAAAAAPVLSVSDVAFDGGEGTAPRRRWAPLPGTALETAAIRTSFGSSAVTILTRNDAREPAVRAALPGRRYLHLATHGYVEEGRSHLLAGLVLSPSPDSASRPDDDGVLQLYEIYGLPLDCELAVLSACETHRGPRVAGEGAFALSRGFLAAGARRVVASQWAVRDEPSAALVGGLFEALAGAGRRKQVPSPALALREAKRRVRGDPRWSDPFYWAPFVLSGR